MGKRILLVEDEKVTRESLTSMFEKRGHEVFADQNTEPKNFIADSLELLKNGRIETAVVDLFIPDAEGVTSAAAGLELIKKIRAYDGNLKIFLFTGGAEIQAMESLSSIGVDDAFSKSDASGVQDLLKAVERQ